MICRNDSTSPASSPSRYRPAISARSSLVGGVMAMAISLRRRRPAGGSLLVRSAARRRPRYRPDTLLLTAPAPSLCHVVFARGGGALMADADDVRRFALALPHVEEIDSDGFDFRVGVKGFVWSYPERAPGKP